MKHYSKMAALAVLSVGTFLAACSDDETGTTATSTSTTTSAQGGGGNGGDATGGTGGGTGGTGGGMNFPAPPMKGAALDRMGRPAINTVGTKTFGTTAEQREAAEDAYNENHDPSTWSAQHAGDIAASLGILDALDKPNNNNPAMAGCGNQLLAGAGNEMMPQAAGAYGALAAILADDRLRVFAGGADGSCALYLGVEANAVGVANDECGGRTPIHDVIKVSYSLLSGAFDFTAQDQFPFDDTVTVDSALSTAYAAGFPYLAPAGN